MNYVKLLLLGFPVFAGCTTIGPGKTGVLWNTGSGTQSKLYGEGAYNVWPWNNLFVYDLRTMVRWAPTGFCNKNLI